MSVYLTKRIPVGGGLGGGSSNAAAFLIGINKLYGLKISLKELMKIGKELGADIPFFISGARHAVGQGIGDRIRPVPFKKRLWFVLLTSSKGLSTRKVYEGFRLSHRQPVLTRLNRDVTINRALTNDLTQSAERLQPSLKKIRENVSGLHLGTCRMSGSGPTLFFIYPNRRQAIHALRKLRTHGFSKSAVLCHSY